MIILAAVLVLAGGWLLVPRLFDAESGSGYFENLSELSESEVPRLFAVVNFLGVPIRVAFLDEDASFSVRDILRDLPEEFYEELPDVHFEVRDGALAFIKSDCPDQVCVSMGWQGRAGGFAACLPNQLFFQIERERRIESDVDIIVR